MHLRSVVGQKTVFRPGFRWTVAHLCTYVAFVIFVLVLIIRTFGYPEVADALEAEGRRFG